MSTRNHITVHDFLKELKAAPTDIVAIVGAFLTAATFLSIYGYVFAAPALQSFLSAWLNFWQTIWQGILSLVNVEISAPIAAAITIFFSSSMVFLRSIASGYAMHLTEIFFPDKDRSDAVFLLLSLPTVLLGCVLVLTSAQNVMNELQQGEVFWFLFLLAASVAFLTSSPRSFLALIMVIFAMMLLDFLFVLGRAAS